MDLSLRDTAHIIIIGELSPYEIRQVFSRGIRTSSHQNLSECRGNKPTLKRKQDDVECQQKRIRLESSNH